MALQRSVKVVVVGDGAVGKTCMLMSFVEGVVPEEYVPTVFDNHTVAQQVGQETISMHLWDTAGQEAYDRLRTISYADSHLFLLCFSIASPTSFDNIRDKWHPEVKHYSSAPFLLVGTKTDLREDRETLERLAERGGEPVTYAQGMALARRLGAATYLECSAITQEGLKETFAEAAKIALDGGSADKGKEGDGRKKCNLL